MFNSSITSREWRYITVDGEPAQRLFLTAADGSVYSCDASFGDFKMEEPTNAELEQKLKEADFRN